LVTEVPTAEQARLSSVRQSGSWTSALSTTEFAAIRSVGFEPAGQVLGAAVYNVGFAGYGCPTYGVGSAEAIKEFNKSHGYGRTEFYTQVSTLGTAAAFGPLVQTLHAARSTALARMTRQCAALGAHGVVGVTLTLSRSSLGLEFVATGTAVRAPGAILLPQPFTSGLTGQDFAKLLSAGFVPVSLVLGIVIGVRHDDLLVKGQRRRTLGNIEAAGYTNLVHRARAAARIELEKDVVRVGGQGVVVQRNELRIGEQECRGAERSRDYLTEVTMIGTAIVAFGPERPAAERPSLAILSIDPRRRAPTDIGRPPAPAEAGRPSAQAGPGHPQAPSDAGESGTVREGLELARRRKRRK
jgi:uncharacterized protein YbjQ (UPF0145 family)